jgi:outer membrane protein OmpA-like peptidoglycan-associated protein
VPSGGQLGARPGAPGGRAGLSPQGGNINELRQQRQVRTDPSGKATFIQEGNRTIVKEGNRTIIRADENERFRRFGGDSRVERRGNETYNIIRRPGGGDIINVTDRDGNLVRRVRRGHDGREVVLIDNRRRGPGFGTGLAIGLAAGVTAGILLNLPPPVVNIPRERYIVDLEGAPPHLLYETLDAPPLMAIERPYSLDEIRYNVELRDRMRRIDINTINFEFGSWEVSPDQYDRLVAIAEAIQRLLSRDSEAIVMIEGYTDAVGSDEDNLSLSDRRAESVAIILTEHFQIPPENLVTQGYGEQFLKVPTDGPSRENRRVAVRNVGPLLKGRYAAR